MEDTGRELGLKIGSKILHPDWPSINDQSQSIRLSLFVVISSWTLPHGIHTTMSSSKKPGQQRKTENKTLSKPATSSPPVPPPPPTSSPSKAIAKKRIHNTLQFTTSPSKVSKPEPELIGYVLEISTQRRNKLNTLDYCTFSFQTSATDVVLGLLYSKHKRQLLVESAEKHTAIKLKNITYTEDGKVIVNDMTNISTPQMIEYDFQYQAGLKKQETEPITILEVLNTHKEWDVVSVQGKVISLNQQRQVGSPKKKLYTLAEGILADETGSIPFDIWESHVDLLKQGQSYTISNVNVRVWGGKKKLSTLDTKVKDCNNETFQLVSTVVEDNKGRNSLVDVRITEVDSIQHVEQYLCCAKCTKKITQGSSGNNIVKCDSCGSLLRTSRCPTKMFVKLTVQDSDGEDLQLKIDSDVLATMLTVNKDDLDVNTIAHKLFSLKDFSLIYNSETLTVVQYTM